MQGNIDYQQVLNIAEAIKSNNTNLINIFDNMNNYAKDVHTAWISEVSDTVYEQFEILAREFEQIKTLMNMQSTTLVDIVTKEYKPMDESLATEAEALADNSTPVVEAGVILPTSGFTTNNSVGVVVSEPTSTSPIPTSPVNNTPTEAGPVVSQPVTSEVSPSEPIPVNNQPVNNPINVNQPSTNFLIENKIIATNTSDIEKYNTLFTDLSQNYTKEEIDAATNQIVDDLIGKGYDYNKINDTNLYDYFSIRITEILNITK